MMNHMFNEMAQVIARAGCTPLANAVELLVLQRNVMEKRRKEELLSRANMLSVVFTAAMVQASSVLPQFAEKAHRDELCKQFSGAITEAAGINLGKRNLASLFDFLEFLAEKYDAKAILDTYWYFYQMRIASMAEKKDDLEFIKYMLYINPWETDRKVPDFVMQQVLAWRTAGIMQMATDITPRSPEDDVVDQVDSADAKAHQAIVSAVAATFGVEVPGNDIDVTFANEAQAPVPAINLANVQAAIAAAAEVGVGFEAERMAVSPASPSSIAQAVAERLNPTEVNLPQAATEVTQATSDTKPVE